MDTESKTPHFDTALNLLLETLKPHTKKCVQHEQSQYCEKEFKITEKDIEFLKILRVPPPSLCPTCRRQKRLAFINRLYFYKRKNDAPEGSGLVLSYIPPDSRLKVYDFDYYRSSKWDPLAFGVVYDKQKSFFDQLYDLRLKVPHPAIIRDPASINCEYTLNGRNNKNCYCVSGTFGSEDIWYSTFVQNSKQVMDGLTVKKTENSYFVCYPKKSNFCFYTWFSRECVNCYFLYDCRNCQDCFGCVNLRNKRYCYFNQQLTKEEYEAKIKSLNLGSRKEIDRIKEEFWNMVKQEPVRASRNERSENVDGVIIINSKNIEDAISTEKCEHDRHVDAVVTLTDSMDVYGAGASERMYESAGSGSHSSNVKFTALSKDIRDCEYVISCRNSHHLFGCFSLDNKAYCIFNKQYSEEDYFKTLDEIKLHLFEKGEYGSFFPYEFSSFAYNGSEADFTYPLSAEAVQRLGSFNQSETDVDFQGMEILKPEEVPDSIDEISDAIVQKAIVCSETGRPFRIIQPELEFYRRHKIPVPIIHPYRRMKKMFAYMGNNHFYEGRCENCSKEVKTIYPPKEQWRLHCDDCYQKIVT